MEDLVSIIIPAFNVEKYINICVADLMKQTHKNIEIIIVDDGSTDNTHMLCDALASQYTNVRVFHQKNMGVSSARNVGTQLAKGDYIIYMDADDFLAHNAISDGLAHIHRYGADLVIAREIMVYPDQVQELELSSKYKNVLLEPEEFDELRKAYLGFVSKRLLDLGEIGDYSGRPCERLIRADVAKNTLFPSEIPLGEDKIWNLRLLSKCRSICVLGDCWYKYIVYSDSAVRAYHGNRREKGELFINTLYKENKEFCEKYKNVFVENIAIMLYCLAYYDLIAKDCPMTNKEKRKFMNETISRIPWKYLWDDKNNKYLSAMHRAMLPLYKTGAWIFPLKAYKFCKQIGIVKYQNGKNRGN